MIAGSGIAPEKVEEGGDEDIGGIEKHGGGALARLAEIGGKNRGRKRNGSDAEEEKKIENEEQIIGTLDVGEEAVMIDPHDADKGETNDKRDVKRPIQ